MDRPELSDFERDLLELRGSRFGVATASLDEELLPGAAQEQDIGLLGRNPERGKRSLRGDQGTRPKPAGG